MERESEGGRDGGKEGHIPNSHLLQITKPRVRIPPRLWASPHCKSRQRARSGYWGAGESDGARVSVTLYRVLSSSSSHSPCRATSSTSAPSLKSGRNDPSKSPTPAAALKRRLRPKSHQRTACTRWPTSPSKRTSSLRATEAWIASASFGTRRRARRCGSCTGSPRSRSPGTLRS